MIRLGLIPLLLLLLSSATCIAGDAVEGFLQSREVLDRVYFEEGSNRLSNSARDQLDPLVIRLKEITKEEILFRIEGFAGKQDEGNAGTGLAMSRALAVRNYLRDRHGLNLDIYLTGISPEASPTQGSSPSRVDIALYRQDEAAAVLFDDLQSAEAIELR